MPKIKISCTKEQWHHFRVHTCPAKFDPSWKDIYSQNCEFNGMTDCYACWDEYVDWEIKDECPYCKEEELNG